MKPVRVLFFGTPEFAAVSLRALLANPEFEIACVVTQPDRPAGRGNKLSESPIKQLAREHGISCLQPGRIKRELKGFLEQLTAHGPFDVGVVVAFGQILPLAVLNLPAAGSVNVHASLLPRWRGAAPIQQAILAGDVETGVGLMRMEEGLDTGPVYISATAPIKELDTAGTLHDSLAQLGAELLANNLSAIAAGQLAPVTQPTDGVTYATKISNEDCQITWSEDAAAIARKVRALNPIPGAFTSLKGKRLKIFLTATKTPRAGLALCSPGEIYFSSADVLEIQCGDGLLALQELQLEGKRKMAVAEFLRGIQVSRGDRLGL